MPALNPSGMCQCGCGELAPLARETRTAKGWVKGEPILRIKGHNLRSRDCVPIATRFEARVDRSPGLGPAGTCHLWTGVPDRKGYGQVFIEGRVMRAHRVSWFVAYGVWPTLCVLHRCDVPLCQNPDHLFEGTQADNMRDMALKGRAMKEHPWCRGQRNHTAKLTEEAVREIRALRGIETQKALAARYGVAHSLISAVQTRRAWAWLP